MKEEGLIAETTSEATSERDTPPPAQSDCAEVAADEELDNGSFWALLARAGYTTR